MRTRFSFPLLLSAALLFAAPTVECQDRPFFRGLFGPKPKVAAKGRKRVEINLTEQTLRAWDGPRLVLKTNISSGRGRSTPTARFRAGYKDADHYSSLYHNAPMAWSVQVSGNIFIHGFTSVPNYPASHGCIRMANHDILELFDLLHEHPVWCWIG